MIISLSVGRHTHVCAWQHGTLFAPPGFNGETVSAYANTKRERERVGERGRGRKRERGVDRQGRGRARARGRNGGGREGARERWGERGRFEGVMEDNWVLSSSGGSTMEHAFR